MAAVNKGEMSIYKAVLMHNMPYHTLIEWIK